MLNPCRHVPAILDLERARARERGALHDGLETLGRQGGNMGYIHEAKWSLMTVTPPISLSWNEAARGMAEADGTHEV